MVPAIPLALAIFAFLTITTALEANCTDSTFIWAFNSKGFSPCHVASQLVEPCISGFIIPPLPAGSAYFGPSAGQNDSCRCNTVYYSLLSACGACQGNNFVNWTTYAQNCTQVFSTLYPNPLPATVKIPHWAFLDVTNVTTSGGTFDADLAQRAGDEPESGGASGSTNTGGNNSTSSPSSNAGVIAGGVIGAVVGVALIAGAALFFYRRRDKKSTEKIFDLSGGKGVLSMSPTPSTWIGPPLNAIRSQRPYDPQDPATFPTQLQANRPIVGQALTGSSFGTTYSDTQQSRVAPPPIHFTGVPEVY